ncbi:hypothetical protein GRI55_14565 [Erythrobacter citreus]|uniref:Oligosaccharide flippase family protein n=1 Tax=Qipengyuania citrea TaxID=225971 RepID=A0A6I4UEU4_9SPHN|nr:hypothetical protein [Qipengyuania citrea]MDQ0564870.1 hypothetical protein [Qipengyuania citrea]MXP36956.1 hypothetical protein [Qipengyuania citrea]
MRNVGRLEQTLFSATKVVGLIVRPLILLFFLRTDQDSLAQDFSLLLTATASSFIILNNQNYRVAYQLFLGSDRSSHGLRGRDVVRNYVVGTLVHILAFIGVASLVLWLWLDRGDLLVLAMILILIEKFFDDDQRILVYKKRYYQWMINFTLRIIAPAIALIIVSLATDIDDVSLYVMSATLGVAVYIYLIRRQFFRISYRLVKIEFKQGISISIRRYFSEFRNEFFVAQVWAFLAANAILIDRFFINISHENIFADYIFAVSVANTIQTFHNLGYITFQRPRLLQADAIVISSVFNRMNLLLPFVLFIIIFTLYLLSIMLEADLTPLSFEVILSLCGLYYMHAVSLPAKEMAFWRLRRNYLIAQECVLFTFPIVGYGLGFNSQLGIVLATLCGLVVRLGLLITMLKLAETRQKRFNLRL